MSKTADWKAAEKNHSWHVLLTMKARLTVLTASCKRNHNVDACRSRAEIGVCLRRCTCISKFQTPLFHAFVCMKLMHLDNYKLVLVNKINLKSRNAALAEAEAETSCPFS